MPKIIVIGSPGAGKSVFSKKLSNITNLPLYHIDMLYHKKDGTHISKEELENKLRNIFKNDDWIIDGNYQKTLEMRIKECDTIFLLDFPTEVCLEGAKSRIGKKRDDLPWIEEKLDENFEQSITKFADEKLPQIYKLLDKYKMNHNIIIFKSRDETDNYIAGIDKKQEIQWNVCLKYQKEKKIPYKEEMKGNNMKNIVIKEVGLEEALKVFTKIKEWDRPEAGTIEYCKQWTKIIEEWEF